MSANPRVDATREIAIAMSAVYRTDSPPGPAGRWFIDHLKQEDAQRLKQTAFTNPEQLFAVGYAASSGTPTRMAA
jgi:hypothetical protein